MLLIPCPHCGQSAQTEFTYGSDASVRRPLDPASVSDEQWLNYVYLRQNPCGQHEEWWYHGAGCHQWIVVSRDTRTHQIYGAVSAEEHAVAGDER